MHQRQRQRLRDPAALHLLSQFADRLLQLAQIVEFFPGRFSKARQGFEQQLSPGRWQLGLGQLLVQMLQAVDKAPERTERQRGRTFGLTGRQQLCKRLIDLIRQSVAEEQTVQPVGQGMRGVGRHAESGAVLGVERPAHARGGDPVAQLLQAVVIELEAPRDAGLLQQTEQGARREARTGQVEDGQQRLGMAVGAAAGAAGDRVGDVTVFRGGAENRFDQGRCGFEVRHDDQNLRRRQLAASLSRLSKQAQQMVLQHLEFARQRMAAMDFKAAVLRVKLYRTGLQISQIEDCVLQAGQQGVGRILREAAVVLGRLAALIDQQVDMRLGLFAPGSQQPRAFFMVLILPACSQMAQAPAVDDLEPIFATGVDHIDLQIDDAAKLLQQLDMQRRHRRQTKDMGAGRQAGSQCACRVELLELGDETAALLQSVELELVADASPQRRLPAFIGQRSLGLAAELGGKLLTPVGQPFRAVGDILVEQSGDAASQLEAHHRIGLTQPGRQARMQGNKCRVAEGAVNPPGQHRRRQRRFVGHIGQQPGHLLPQPLGQVIELHIGADAALFGQA